ncbi:MAG TPA: TRAP transporter substrate-binding protein [Candidatus Bathyarchaeia archaeon]|nr:TRAP transporter substrate-binding protein [Candidatus Bathyarchaeia archaeon]
MLTRRAFLCGSAVGALATAGSRARLADAQDARSFTFAYDQPRDTAYSFMADTFEKKLGELSGGKFKIRQFPSAALGSEPETAQKVRVGDIDFVINATANTSSVAPQSGVFSLHFIFRDEGHLERCVNDKGVNDAFKAMIAESVQGARSLGLFTQGFRNMYAKFPVSSAADVVGKKVRVQATKTEDAFFTAYKALPIHMPFGQVYTSLQTGLIQIAENGNDVVLKNKHYEAAPVVSQTEHEANNSHLWVSQKTWDSLTPEQRQWVVQAADYSLPIASKKALELNTAAVASLQKVGVKYVDKVDKKSFSVFATPLQDSQAQELGKFAVQILALVRGVK